MDERSANPALLLFAVGYNVAHHNGVFFQGLGSLGDTRIADWIDLLTPFAVLGPLAWALSVGRTTRTNVVLFLVGVVVYVEGHGIHLAANSIGNVVLPDSGGADVIHLWDEVVGHYVWYAGAALAVVAVYRAVEFEAVPCGPLPIGLAGLTGLTWATNGLEGGTAIFSLLCAVVGFIVVWRKRVDPIPRLALVASAAAVIVLAAYGIRYGGFPQPSAL